jgi:hypothetical protein
MAKQQSFADKANKAGSKKYQDCPKCGAPLTPVLMIASEKQANGAYKFRHHNVRVCKCNEKAVYV